MLFSQTRTRYVSSFILNASNKKNNRGDVSSSSSASSLGSGAVAGTGIRFMANVIRRHKDITIKKYAPLIAQGRVELLPTSTAAYRNQKALNDSQNNNNNKNPTTSSSLITTNDEQKQSSSSSLSSLFAETSNKDLCEESQRLFQVISVAGMSGFDEVNESKCLAEQDMRALQVSRKHICQSICVLLEAFMMVLCHPVNKDREIAPSDVQTYCKLSNIFYSLNASDKTFQNQIIQKLSEIKNDDNGNREYFLGLYAQAKSVADEERMLKDLKDNLLLSIAAAEGDEPQQEQQVKHCQSGQNNNNSNKTNSNKNKTDPENRRSDDLALKKELLRFMSCGSDHAIDLSNMPSVRNTLWQNAGIAEFGDRLASLALNSASAVASSLSATTVRLEYSGATAILDLTKHALTFYDPKTWSENSFMRLWTREVILAKSKYKNPRMFIEIVWEFSHFFDNVIVEQRKLNGGLLLPREFFAKKKSSSSSSTTINQEDTSSSNDNDNTGSPIPSSSLSSSSASSSSLHPYNDSHMHLYDDLDFASDLEAIKFLNDNAVFFITMCKHPRVMDEVMFLVRKAFDQVGVTMTPIDEVANLDRDLLKARVEDEIEDIRDLTGELRDKSLSRAERIAAAFDRKNRDRKKILAEYEEATKINNAAVDEETRRGLMEKFIDRHFRQSFQFNWSGSWKTAGSPMTERVERYAEKNNTDFSKMLIAPRRRIQGVNDHHQNNNTTNNNNTASSSGKDGQHSISWNFDTQNMSEEQIKRAAARKYRKHLSSNFNTGPTESRSSGGEDDVLITSEEEQKNINNNNNQDNDDQQEDSSRGNFNNTNNNNNNNDNYEASTVRERTHKLFFKYHPQLRNFKLVEEYDHDEALNGVQPQKTEDLWAHHGNNANNNNSGNDDIVAARRYESSDVGILYGVPVKKLPRLVSRGYRFRKANRIGYDGYDAKMLIAHNSRVRQYQAEKYYDDDNSSSLSNNNNYSTRQQQLQQEQEQETEAQKLIAEIDPQTCWFELHHTFLAICSTIFFVTFVRDAKSIVPPPSSRNSNNSNNDDNDDENSNNHDTENNNDGSSNNDEETSAFLPSSSSSSSSRGSPVASSDVADTDQKFLKAVQSRYTVRRAEVTGSAVVQTLVKRVETFVRNLLNDYHSNKGGLADLYPNGVVFLPSTIRDIESRSRLASTFLNTLVDFSVVMLPISQDDTSRQRHIVTVVMNIQRTFMVIQRDTPLFYRVDFLMKDIALRIAENRQVSPLSRLYICQILGDTYSISRDRNSNCVLIRCQVESLAALERMGSSRRTEIIKNRLGSVDSLRHLNFSYRWEHCPPQLLMKLAEGMARYIVIRDMAEFNSWCSELCYIDQIDDTIYTSTALTLTKYVHRYIPNADFEDALCYGRYMMLFCRCYATQKVNGTQEGCDLALSMITKLMERVCEFAEPTSENFFGAVSSSSSSSTTSSGAGTATATGTGNTSSSSTTTRGKTSSNSSSSSSSSKTSSRNNMKANKSKHHSSSDEKTSSNNNNRDNNNSNATHITTLASQNPPLPRPVALQMLLALYRAAIFEHSDFIHGKYKLVYEKFLSRIHATMTAYPNQRQFVFSHLQEYLRYAVLFATDFDDQSFTGLQSKAIDSLCQFFTRSPEDYLPLVRRTREYKREHGQLPKKFDEKEEAATVYLEAARMSSQIVVDPLLVDPLMSSVTSLQEAAAIAQQQERVLQPQSKNNEGPSSLSLQNNRDSNASVSSASSSFSSSSSSSHHRPSHRHPNYSSPGNNIKINMKEPIDEHSVALQTVLCAALTSSGYNGDFDSEVVYRACRLSSPLGLSAVFRFLSHVSEILFLSLRVQFQNSVRHYLFENVFKAEPYLSIMQQFNVFSASYLTLRLDAERVFDVGPPSMMRVSLQAEIALELLKRAVLDGRERRAQWRKECAAAASAAASTITKNKSSSSILPPAPEPPRQISETLAFMLRFCMALDKGVSPLVGRKDDGSLHILLKHLMEHESRDCFGTSDPVVLLEPEDQKEHDLYRRLYVEQKMAKRNNKNNKNKSNNNNNTLMSDYAEVLPDDLLYMKNSALLSQKFKEKIDYHFSLVPDSIKRFITFQDCAIFDYEYINQEASAGVDFTSAKSIEQWRRGLTLNTAVRLVRELVSDDCFPQLRTDPRVCNRIPYLVKAMQCRWFKQSDVDEFANHRLFAPPQTPSSSSSSSSNSQFTFSSLSACTSIFDPTASMPCDYLQIQNYIEEKKVLNANNEWVNHKWTNSDQSKKKTELAVKRKVKALASPDGIESSFHSRSMENAITGGRHNRSINYTTSDGNFNKQKFHRSMQSSLGGKDQPSSYRPHHKYSPSSPSPYNSNNSDDGDVWTEMAKVPTTGGANKHLGKSLNKRHQSSSGAGAGGHTNTNTKSSSSSSPWAESRKKENKMKEGDTNNNKLEFDDKW